VAKKQVTRKYTHSRPDSGIREARTAQRKLAEEVRAGKTSAHSATVGQLADRYLQHSVAIGRTPNTIHGYRAKFQRIEDALGDIKLSKLNTSDVDSWYGTLAAGGMTPASIRHFHRLLVAALNQGMRWGWVGQNVATLATPPKVPRFEVAPPTAHRVDKLIELARLSRIAYFSDLLFFVAATGLRRGEVCGLRWTDIDWSHSTFTVNRSVAQTGAGISVGRPKSGQTRKIPIDPSVKELLRDRQGKAKADAKVAVAFLVDDAYVWSQDADGNAPLRPDTVTQHFNRLCRKAEGPAIKRARRENRALRDDERWRYRFHDLRHFFATNLLSKGIDVNTVAYLLGHADASFTLRVYGHAIEERGKEAARLAASGLSR
jgi:integrase